MTSLLLDMNVTGAGAQVHAGAAAVDLAFQAGTVQFALNGGGQIGDTSFGPFCFFTLS